MGFAFAGLLGLAAAGRVSERVGAAMGLAVLLLAPVCVHLWAANGNLLAWVVLQFGGMALVLALACVRPRIGAIDIRWGWIIAAYTAAKILELGDHEVYAFTGHLVSGHTLKHVVAALTAWPVICALGALRFSRQNAARLTSTKAISAGRAHYV